MTADMEYFDLYDRNRQKTDRTLRRGEKMPAGMFHVVVHLCVLNSHNELLIQRRRDDKEGFPGLWDLTVGGSAVRGESSLEAVRREAREELGLNVPDDMLPSFTMMYSEGFDDYYILRADPDLGALVLQKEEVSEVRWASMAEVLNRISLSSFIPYRPELIRLIWSMQAGDGAFSDAIPQFGREE